MSFISNHGTLRNNTNGHIVVEDGIRAYGTVNNEGSINGNINLTALSDSDTHEIARSGSLVMSSGTINGSVNIVSGSTLIITGGEIISSGDYTVFFADWDNPTGFIPSAPVGLAVHGSRPYGCDSFARKVFVISF